MSVCAADGKRHFKEGIKHSNNLQWDKAAEQYALAAAEDPSNTEYQLHLKRALVNAGLMMVELGNRLAEQKDFAGAYSAYRRATAFDPGNELAGARMHRMLEAQGLGPGETGLRAGTSNGGHKSLLAAHVAAGTPPAITNSSLSPQLRKTDVILRNTNLMAAIEQLAQSMRLNVAFDQQSETAIKSRQVNLELQDITGPQALQVLLHMHNLTYVQVARRTIVVVQDNAQNRLRYEPMAVRAFPIYGADVNEVKAAITGIINPKQLVVSKQQNALLARDTPANLELIDSLIRSLDKSRAEVLIDVKLYEVSRNALLEIGNQLRDSGSQDNPVGLRTAGGIGQQAAIAGNAVRTLKGPLDFALGLPSSTLSIFQDKGKAKLLASTQVHVLDNEQHQIRIGQRVPYKSGSTLPGVTGQPGTGTPPVPPLPGYAFESIQYQDVGLNIDMQPQVFEDEVQVKMKIESSSVDRSSGDLTPSFNQRTMSSVARTKTGQTTMIAAVSQNEESRRTQGIPVLGLIPILGRFFATPTMSNRRNDMVITVTPHILRRADFGENEHLAKDAGRGQDTSRVLTVEQILYQADLDDAREDRIARNASVDPPGSLDLKPTPTDSPAAVVSNGIVRPQTTSLARLSTVSDRPAPRIERVTVEGPPQDLESFEKAGEGPGEPAALSLSFEAEALPPGVKDQAQVAVVASHLEQLSPGTICVRYDPRLLEITGIAGGLASGIRYSTREDLLIVTFGELARGDAGRGRLFSVMLKGKTGSGVDLAWVRDRSGCR